MKLEELQNLWNSKANEPSPEQRQEMIGRLVHGLRRKRRQEIAWMAWTFLVLTVLTVFAGWLIFATDKFSFGSEWGMIPLLLIPWFFAVLFLRRFLRQNGRIPQGEVSVLDSLKAAWKANRAEQSKMRAIGVMYLIVVPVLGFGMWQLVNVGKVSSRELVSMVIFLGGALAISALAVFARYRLRLLPEGEKIEDLLRQASEMGR